ncbi:MULTISPECIES: alkaline phosphatase family protein [Streptomyces]|uniref:PglZ domain-containing protein n=1 Tax=Streptomyces tsukubensis (strain DSM 42081 / NBRC 108919 / NRRL 18488 / 9993) TaxID=1114943 RepID=I2N7M2_STRT9|nr:MULTISPECIES: nucleotide pyrophosphatase/phosphodiesterase family protein [Streptomyces]AZK96930.1 alkaline phosphatase family protein [Streptomyces tsukubensis]EIF93019.1 phosphodiesterase [Streptomyces tsukubensis NRRL18488]MYS66600.1 PglZ domain-containing protein [Streptomyces sp. SID5473]QKM67086.1 PglZ domain-containing protein [Streptomyces tsukubensis NRRL18488]TAI41433.1 alkaline phosphatase family protein [Streptomyces tsukubensis]
MVQPDTAAFWPDDPLPLAVNSAPVPEYGSGSLADLLPTLAAGLGVPGFTAAISELVPADRVCVFLIDGLGWEQIRNHPEHAPYLHSLLHTSRGGTGRPITAGFPATTATSLASVGTGLPPGLHGLPGYSVRNPATGALMNQLRWKPYTDPHAWQPHPTVFGLAHEAGVRTAQVSSPLFETTPLTRIALSGGTFHGRLSGEERMDLAAEQLAAADRSLVYTYYSDVDGMGHRYGVDSDAWRGQLAHADRLVQRLAEQLPRRTALYVTADHGMIDVPFDEESRVDFDEDWELRAGVALLGGEGRARHVYAVPGAAADVLTVWREVLGDRFWVASREEAIAAGWFGPVVDERVLGRIGDVVAAACEDLAITASVQEPLESALAGMHGSMTPAEQLVPLIEIRS